MVSVIVCTFNRDRLLEKALDSIIQSTLPPGFSWEIVVVDNNSTDRTREITQDLSRQHGQLVRYVFEPRQGKSHALNTGVHEARGEILAFVDDDVVVDSAWLHNLTASLHDGRWAGAGGRILPAESFSPPPWLALDGPYSLAWMIYAHFDLGEQPRLLDGAPFGTNMAFRKAMFTKYGGFRIDLGPAGNSGTPRFNEDTEFGRRLMAAGERLRYEPGAIVYHRVPDERISREFVLAQWFELGRSWARETPERPSVCKIPRYYFSIPKGFVSAAVRWLQAAEPQQRFFMQGRLWFSAGLLTEHFRHARENRRGRRTKSLQPLSYWK